MLVELFKMSGGNWGVYNVKANKVAIVPTDQIQLFQTLKFRLIVALAFYSLLSFFGNVSIWLRIGGAMLFYVLITFYYYQRALPGLKWMSYDQLTVPQRQDVTSFFQSEKVMARIGFSFLISVLAIVGFQTQPKISGEFSLEQVILILLAITMIVEGLRHVVLLLTLKKQAQV
ncbi:hypothetical protein NHG34_08125 [Aerococcaceae bacterium NML190938]|nr:hypothetical protein [Aerococcaceae bacterium NML190938]